MNLRERLPELKNTFNNRYFLVFALIWAVFSFGLSRYEPERGFIWQLFVALFYGAQFLLVFFLVPYRVPAERARNVGEPEIAGIRPGVDNPGASVRAPLHETCFLLALFLISMALEYWLWPGLLRMRHSLIMEIGMAWALYFVFPVIYFRFRGYKLSDIMPVQAGGVLKPALIAALIVIPFLIGSSNSAMFIFKGGLPPHKLLAGSAAALFAGFMQAGFFEEFFFRALLQERLAALLRSEAGGLFAASLVFGLYHLPSRLFGTGGNYGHSLCLVLSCQMFIGPIFGLLWLRTRNLAVPVFVHSLFDGISGFHAIGRRYGVF
jgi:membrane protease YdiL (CAAX protease family)